jgi:hypothetical protein
MIPGMAPVGSRIFVPTDISGLQLWLDGSDGATITSASSLVSQWNDKSGNGRNVTQAVGGNKPFRSGSAVQNGLAALLFDHNHPDYMVNASAAMLRSVSGWSIFITQRTLSNTIQRVPVAVHAVSNTSGRLQMFINTTTGFDTMGGRRNNADAFASTVDATQASTTWRLVSGIASFTATTVTQRINRAQVSQNVAWLTSGTTPNDAGDLTIGNSPALSAAWDGYIGEILIYDSTLSSPNINLVEAYLTVKWATP